MEAIMDLNDGHNIDINNNKNNIPVNVSSSLT